MSNEREDDDVARAWGGRTIPVALGVLAVVYLAALWSEAVKSGTSAKWLPAPLADFTQVATLFPGAARAVHEYRVEGYRCHEKAWAEIDVRPWFPIEADNKESRFYRALFFYGDAHPHRQTLHALDEFIVDHHNADQIDAAAQGRGEAPIGGVRFVRLRVPFGAPGEGSARYQQKPLAEYPEDQRTNLYYTPESKREERCRQIGR
jgi:hypothetical protein